MKKLNKAKKKKLLSLILSVLGIFAFVLLSNPTEQELKEVLGENGGEIVNTVVDMFLSDTDGVNIDIDTSTFDNYDSRTDVFNDIPVWDGESAYIAVNGNVPFFTEAEKQQGVFEKYADLDNLGRCGVAYANICKELMPTEKREDIGSVTPSGWKYNGKSNNNQYDKELVDGTRIYNRCHLIGFQLAGENANKKNLITGTRYLNIEGMLPFENMIDDYVDETNNHVLFRVTPIYEGDNLVANGVLMEAWSIEDEGEGICFNVYVFNVQPGIEIDYATGQNWLI